MLSFSLPVNESPHEKLEQWPGFAQVMYGDGCSQTEIRNFGEDVEIPL